MNLSDCSTSHNSPLLDCPTPLDGLFIGHTRVILRLLIAAVRRCYSEFPPWFTFPITTTPALLCRGLLTPHDASPFQVLPRPTHHSTHVGRFTFNRLLLDAINREATSRASGGLLESNFSTHHHHHYHHHYHHHHTPRFF